MATLERETDWIDKTEESLEIALGDLAKNHEEAAEGIDKMWRKRRDSYNGTFLSRQSYMIFLADCLASVVQINSAYGV